MSSQTQSTDFLEDMFERISVPSSNGYWQEVSYGEVSLTTDVFGWYTLPGARSAYSFRENTPGYDASGLVQDCANQADPDVDFTQYDGVAVMLNSPSPVAIWT